MTLLKWYSIVLILISTFAAVYTSGEEEDSVSSFISFILMLPVIIYLFMK